jgi:hypothetical protein
MTRRVLIGSLFVLICAPSISVGHHLSAKSDSTVYVATVDAGLFPAANRVGVGWYPSYSIRAGVGSGNSQLTGFLFVDYYWFKLSEPGGLHSFLDQSARRNDIALYPAVWIYRIFFVGAGLYSTHSDNVSITSIHGTDPWTGGNITGIRLLFTVGLTWDFHLTNEMTVPIGIYYRNPGYDADNVLLAFRAGFAIRFR